MALILIVGYIIILCELTLTILQIDKEDKYFMDIRKKSVQEKVTTSLLLLVI